MTPSTRYTIRIALIVALGGFLMGFDASVISGVIKFIETEFDLTKIQLPPCIPPMEKLGILQS